ncbi:DUF6221 family protein [Arthrobacter sp. Alg241-R88]|uniref:DUF6221 family protein n=1 Tax=Arthrobacter sp. Alg241-R88 TaxID=2305984 RepID=UPI0013D16A74|nr:DUF6221 family protein [Arthrobacter sp. Alg241-R88]
MTLTDFLHARIDDDEARAEFVRRQNEDPWHRPFEVWKLSWHDEYNLLCIEPERALAECEAKRRIVERCSAVDYAMPSTHLAHGILGELALPYADHPDFKDEWRP